MFSIYFKSYQSTNESNGGLITKGGGWKDFVLKKRSEY